MFPKKIIQISSILMLFLVCAFSTASAQKYGHLDANALLYDLPTTQKALTELEELKVSLNKDITDRETKLQQRYVEVQQTAQNYSPVQLQQIEQEIQKAAAEIQEARNKAQLDLINKEQELTAPIYQKIRTAIDEVAKENGYTHILDVSSLLYVDENLGNDIAPLVRKKLGL